MIDIIFTVDYEIYGNGTGSLRELVYEPAEKMMALFHELDSPFVAFVEIAELEMIDAQKTDEAIDSVKKQVRKFNEEGVEIGLHLHPQWHGASFQNGSWILDYKEYNLSILSRERIYEIIDRSLCYLRSLLGDDDFTPFSFRAGNWLFQPTRVIADVLAKRNISVDSSVFKGGLQHRCGMDYRPAIGNGYFWTFTDDVNIPDTQGRLLELPIYTRMVPFWMLLTAKRVSLQRRSSSSVNTRVLKDSSRLLDFMRIKYPLKLDFCRMTKTEMTLMMDKIVREDSKDHRTYRPIVAIGHTKDLIDLGALKSFLKYLKNQGISISTFKGAYPRCVNKRTSKP